MWKCESSSTSCIPLINVTLTTFLHIHRFCIFFSPVRKKEEWNFKCKWFMWEQNRENTYYYSERSDSISLTTCLEEIIKRIWVLITARNFKGHSPVESEWVPITTDSACVGHLMEIGLIVLVSSCWEQTTPPGKKKNCFLLRNLLRSFTDLRLILIFVLTFLFRTCGLAAAMRCLLRDGQGLVIILWHAHSCSLSSLALMVFFPIGK